MQGKILEDNVMMNIKNAKLNFKRKLMKWLSNLIRKSLKTKTKKPNWLQHSSRLTRVTVKLLRVTTRIWWLKIKSWVIFKRNTKRNNTNLTSLKPNGSNAWKKIANNKKFKLLFRKKKTRRDVNRNCLPGEPSGFRPTGEVFLPDEMQKKLAKRTKKRRRARNELQIQTTLN